MAHSLYYYGISTCDAAEIPIFLLKGKVSKPQAEENYKSLDAGIVHGSLN